MINFIGFFIMVVLITLLLRVISKKDEEITKLKLEIEDFNNYISLKENVIKVSDSKQFTSGMIVDFIGAPE